MRKKRALSLVFFIAALTITSAGSSTHAALQEKDPSEYMELSYNLLTWDWDPFSYEIGPPLTQQLAQIGIKVVNQPGDGVLSLKDSPEGPDQPRYFDMYAREHPLRAWPEHLYDRLHSDNDIDGGSNCYNLHDSEMDAMLDAILHAETFNETKQSIHENQLKWAELLPYIPLYISDDVRVIRSKWKDYIWDMPGGAFGAQLNYLTPVRMWAEDGDHEFVMSQDANVFINPMFNRDGRSMWYAMLVYAPLIAWDTQLNPIPWLATDWSSDVVGNKTRITFTIRNNAYWHDGTPVTGEDVAFTFLYSKEAPDFFWYYRYCRHIETAVAEGNTVTVTLDSVQAFALFELGQLFILPKHIREGWDSLDPRWWNPTDIGQHVGCGPFKFVSAKVWDDQRAIIGYTVERFDQFWEPAKIQTFRMRFILNAEDQFEAIKTDEVDTTRYPLPLELISTAQYTPNITVVNYPDMWDYALGFNVETPGLGDYEVRKAIAYALDKQDIVNRAALGWGTPSDSPVPSVFYPTWYNPETPKFTTGDQEQDIALANQILDDAGYIDIDDDGIREFPAFVTADTDGDGLLDWEEQLTYGTDPLKADTDGDGLRDGVEIEGETNATLWDTDGDWFRDGIDPLPTFNNFWIIVPSVGLVVALGIRRIWRKRQLQRLKEVPILLLILSEGGPSIFSQKFELGKQLDDQLIGGLLSAINAFGQDAFAGSATDQITYREYSVVLRAEGDMLFCYIFQGSSYFAREKLDLFAESVRSTADIWTDLDTAKKMKVFLKATDKNKLDQVITDIFQQ